MTAETRREVPNRTRYIPLAVILAAALGFGAYQLHITLRYRLYDGYKAALAPPPERAEASAFIPLGQGEGELSGYALALENESLALYVNASVGNTALLDKRGGRVTYSNPPGAASDPIANPANKETLQSQLIVSYFDENGRTAEVASYKMSSMLGQVALESIPGGVRLTYTLGDTKPKAGLLPIYVKAERLGEILGMMDDRTQNLLVRRWEAVDGNPGVMKLLTSIINNPNQQKSMVTQFEKIGYTDEDRRRDEAETGLADEGVGFVIPMEYRLDGESLLVSIPSSQIKEMGGASIEGVRVLPFMGAAGTGEEGYFVVPNGSGSLIRFNNGKTTADDYRQYVYGLDPLLVTNAMLDQTVTARLPLFGIEREGGGILVRVENGAALAQITASVAGKLNSYNSINAVFALRSSSMARINSSAGESLIPVVEKRKAELDITIRYTFLTGEYSGYSGMARYERERLFPDAKPVPQTDIPAFIDIIGSVTGRRFFLDIAYEGQTPMTTYAQAARIVGALAESGVTRQFVNYQGWFNRGYYHDAASSITPVRELGDVGELQSLAREVEARGGTLFSDVAFQRVPYSSRHYQYTAENARYYGEGGAAITGMWNPLSYDVHYSPGGYRELFSNLLSPKFLGRYASLFMDAFERYGLPGVSLRDLGSVLASDRKRTETITRDEAEAIAADSLAALAAEYPLMVSAANAYALPYAFAVSDAPLSHGAFLIVDEEIPWYGMIISGIMPYAGPPLNLSGVSGDSQLREEALRLIERGASPRFTFTWESSSQMKYTALNPYYSTTFDVWSGAAAMVYNEVNGALSRVAGQGMVLHETVSPGVRRVVYEGGTEFIINYNDLTWTVKEAER
ncbi:MAG: DUF5696 domain-containing protein [Oscillospiraceae bacterium]|jgi:hypothetical protein|nr:DUF5696 domain-containing protein [Oscillospiraceae bacterium]